MKSRNIETVSLLYEFDASNKCVIAAKKIQNLVGNIFKIDDFNIYAVTELLYVYPANVFEFTNYDGKWSRIKDVIRCYNDLIQKYPTSNKTPSREPT